MGFVRSIVDGPFMRWLMADEQKEVFEVVFTTLLNAVFLGLAALLLWPFGAASVALGLAKGYWAFWSAVYMMVALAALFERIFRVDADTHFDAYVISGVLVSGLLQAGWSAFAALVVREASAPASLAAAVVLYFVGVLSCWIAFGIVSVVYGGTIYKTINLPLSVASFVLFCLWPAAGRFLYGWFFDLARAWYGWLLSFFS
ncbi:MAG TPA: hypothetical protein VEQ42_13680 [Pyrinomonadaceae bacterium]|nr:hypothetical protein [Pyrinomonadaceae bacterium]